MVRVKFRIRISVDCWPGAHLLFTWDSPCGPLPVAALQELVFLRADQLTFPWWLPARRKPYRSSILFHKLASSFTWHYFCCALLVGAVTSLPRFKWMINSIHFFMEIGEVLEEHVGLEILLWPFKKNVIMSY